MFSGVNFLKIPDNHFSQFSDLKKQAKQQKFMNRQVEYGLIVLLGSKPGRNFSAAENKDFRTYVYRLAPGGTGCVQELFISYHDFSKRTRYFYNYKQR